MENTKEVHKCSELIFRDWHHHRCNSTGKILREGKWYCKRHDPVAVKEKRDKAYKEFTERQEERINKYEYERLAKKYCENQGFDLNKLKELTNGN